MVADALQLRTDPGLGGRVFHTASAGDVFHVVDGSGPRVVDGLDWYRLTAGIDPFWAAAGSGADRYLELLPPDCPRAEPDLQATILMAAWDRLACFGDRSLTFEGTYGCQGCGGAVAGEFEPGWLAYPLNFDWLFPDFDSDPRYLELRFEPDSSVDRPPVGSIVRVTGHFNDPASSTCRMSDGEGASVDSRTAELLCRERFVIDALDVIGTDPDFTAP